MGISVCKALKVDVQQSQLTASTSPTPGFDLISGSHPVGVALDADGASVWVLNQGTDRVTRISPTGTAADYLLPPSGLGLQLSRGPDGTMWVPEGYRHAVAAIAPDGTVRECALPRKDIEPSATSVAPDGTVWVNEGKGGAIARLSGGAFTEYRFGVEGVNGAEILAAPDGGAWFTVWGAPFLGHIGSNGAMERIPIPGSGTALGLAIAPDGAVWLADFGGDRLVRVGSDRVVTALKASVGAKPQGIAFAPDGGLWFTQSGVDSLAMVRDGGIARLHRTGPWPDHLAITGDGWAWFSEYNQSRIGRLKLS
jgi:virginiamycin B lyase